MAAASFVVQVRGLDQLRERLRSDRLLAPTRSFIADLGKVAQRTAQRAAKPHPADKGTLGRRILLEVDKDTARVFPHRSIAGIAFTIEEGRRPGRRPPYRAIKRWAESHGVVPTGRGNSKFIQELREEIKAKGTKGVHFMREAEQTAERSLKQGIPRTESEIRQAWERS